MKQNKLIYKKFIEKVESLTRPCRKKKEKKKNRKHSKYLTLSNNTM